MNARHYRLVRIATALAVVVSVAIFLVPAAAPLVGQLSPRLSHFRWTSLAVAFGLSLIFWPINAYVWNMVLRALGHGIPGATAIRIWLTTQTCRWLPGGVWHYGSRTLQAVGQGVPSPVAVASMALELLLTVAAWGVVGVVGVGWYGDRQFRLDGLLSLRTMELTLAGMALLMLLIAAAWLFRRRFPQKLLAVRERFASLRTVRPRPLPTALCFLVYAALAVLNGAAFYAVIGSASPGHSVPFWAAVSINALAWIVGLSAIMAPGGLVVREATLALQLGLWLPPAEAVMIAVLWRLVQLAVELICVCGAYAPQLVAAAFARRGKPAAAWVRLSSLETKSSE